jgi:transposase
LDRDFFWLTYTQFARLEPHLPTNTRGKPQVDDRRVISGIAHVLISGCRWKDALGPRTPQDTVQWFPALGGQGRLVGPVYALATTDGGRRGAAADVDRYRRSATWTWRSGAGQTMHCG